ncbi:MAG: FHA domain-containing protein [Anaerolineae bacterium]
MSDDRTAPMDQPDWSRRKVDPDEQKTVFSDQDSPTPPTIRVGDQGREYSPGGGGGGGWGERPGFQRATPPQDATPPPFPPSQPPYGPPAGQPPAGEQPKTMIISERPTPIFAWLVVLDGPDRNSIGTVHTLHPDTTTIGRVTGNRIVLRDETVSSQHARIRREAKEGQEPFFALFDMGSRNGIFVGNRENYKDDENRVYRHELQDGDYVLMGETTLVFKKL